MIDGGRKTGGLETGPPAPAPVMELQEMKTDFQARPCYIIGGGVSVTGFPAVTLAGKNVIGVNWAFRWFDCRLTFAADYHFWRWIYSRAIDAEARKKALTATTIERLSNTGVRVGLSFFGQPLPDFGKGEIAYLKSLGKVGIPRSFSSGIYNGNSSGFCALQIALLLQADPVFLVGFDMKSHDGRIHHYDNEVTSADEWKYTTNMKPHFFKLAGLLSDAGGPRIYTVSRAGIDSDLTCWPTITEGEAIKWQ